MRSLIRLAVGVSALAGATSFVASAQSVISAKSGLIHYVEGRVFLNNQLVETKFGEFPEVKENQELRTEEGRVEVLLTPGVFLRLGENGAIRMVTNRLIDTRLELISGEAVVEADELLKDNGVTIVYKDYAVQLQKQGVYRFDSEPARLRVYDGEALVDLNGKTQEVKEGHALAMEGGLQVASFDRKDVDELYRWGAHRSEYISMANVSAAKMVADSGTYMGDCSWLFNRYYNMYTYVPGYGCGLGNGFASGGFLMNPFGYGFWSPFSVYSYLSTLPYYGGGYYAPYPVTGGGGSGGSSGSKPGHGVQPPIRIPGGGISPAVAARQTMLASTHAAHVMGGGGSSGHGSGSGSGGSFSSSNSSHVSSASSMGGHSGGGGGGGGGGHK
jgi:hypothetical protein